MESARAHLDRARRPGLRDTHPIADLIEQHTAIVDGVEAGNFDTAEHTMRTHLRAVFDDVERIKAKSPQLFSNGSERPTRKVVSSWERGDAVNGEYPDQLRKDIAEFVSQHTR